jgi:hypothetical protein
VDWDQVGERRIMRTPYRGTSLIRNRPPSQGRHRALGIFLLSGLRFSSYYQVLEQGSTANPKLSTWWALEVGAKCISQVA